MSHFMRFCILIPHYHNKNAEWLLDQCLQSIVAFEPELIRHTMILDDASPDMSKHEFFRAIQGKYGVNVCQKRDNAGYSANINLGLNLAEKCGYDVAVTLNNDIELKTPFTKRAEELFARFPKCGVIGARLYFQNGKLQHQGYTVTDHDGNIDMHGAGHFDVSKPSGFMFGVTGAFQIIRLPAVRYNPDYPFSFEDVEFCYRCWEKDIWVYYDSDIVAVHCESATRGYRLGKRELASLNKLRADALTWDLQTVRRRVRSAEECHLSVLEQHP